MKTDLNTLKGLAILNDPYYDGELVQSLEVVPDELIETMKRRIDMANKHQEVIWDNIKQLKFRLLQATSNKMTIEDGIKHQQSLGMKASYKTVKHMNRDLHNEKVTIRKIEKLIRKENLRAEQANR